MKLVVVLLLVSLAVANVTCHPHRPGTMFSFYQFLRWLFQMYPPPDMGNPGGNQTTNMTTTQAPIVPCDLDEFECVPRGTCESQADVQIGFTCPNPNHDCCDD